MRLECRKGQPPALLKKGEGQARLPATQPRKAWRPPRLLLPPAGAPTSTAQPVTRGLALLSRDGVGRPEPRWGPLQPRAHLRAFSRLPAAFRALPLTSGDVTEARRLLPGSPLWLSLQSAAAETSRAASPGERGSLGALKPLEGKDCAFLPPLPLQPGCLQAQRKSLGNRIRRRGILLFLSITP